MPVVAASGKSLLAFDDCLCESQWLCSRLVISLLLLAIALVGLLLCQPKTRRRLHKTLAFLGPAAADSSTWRAGTSFTNITTNLSPDSNQWVPLKQGQALLETGAKLAVSKVRASGTAPAGGGGPRKKAREMEQEERRDAAGSRSRGVSTDWRVGPKVSSGVHEASHVDDAAAAADAELREDSQQRMEDAAHLGSLGGISAGLAFRAAHHQGSPGQISTSFLGHHMMDDEHIIYGVQNPARASSSAGGWSSSARRPEPNFTRSSPPALSLPVSAAGSSQNMGAVQTERTQTMAIPVPLPNRSHDQGFYYAEDTISPSSYPPTSPLLPPPPATTYQDFDPAVVMFPGPARDGGIKMVPVNDNGKFGSDHAHEGVLDGHVDPETSWKRHTRVFGGGVCLACVAAAGDGGYYGANVRPQDKR